MKGLTDIPGVKIGHLSDFDALTGVTVVRCDEGAVGGVDVRGSATGTAEVEALDPGHVAARVHAVALGGGSAFGLEASSGVRRFLSAKGIGFDTGVARVPIVPAAILFDLGIGKPNVYPNREMGEAAALAAHDGPVAEGCVGAGTGATVGKLFGIKRAMKSGIGTVTQQLPGGVLVSALVAVNALGDVRDPQTGAVVAGARTAPDAQDFVDSEKAMLAGAVGGFGGHTTLTVVATNAQLTRVEAKKLAALASIGVVRAIAPINTMADGDITFALSLGTQRANIDALGVAAIRAVEQSILRAVRLAKTMGGVPGLNS